MACFLSDCLPFRDDWYYTRFINLDKHYFSKIAK
nr:MAG TPA: 40S ribosomal protein S17 [Caudoviricetes sp.]